MTRGSCSWFSSDIGLAAMVCALAVALAACGGSRGTGDPNGSVLHQLEVLREAVPPGAIGVSERSNDATWLPACGDGTGAPGWSNVEVAVQFTDAAARAEITSDIDARLRANGWTRHDEMTGQGGLIAHWTRPTFSAPLMQAFAYPVPDGSPNWFMTATWQPSPAVQTGDCA